MIHDHLTALIPCPHPRRQEAMCAPSVLWVTQTRAEAGLRQLEDFCAANTENATRACGLRGGGPQAVVAALREHPRPANADVQGAGRLQGTEEHVSMGRRSGWLACKARRCVSDKCLCPRRLASGGGGRGFGGAPSRPMLLCCKRAAVRYATCVRANNAENQTRAGAAGGVEAVVMALQTHPASVFVLREGCKRGDLESIMPSN